MKLKTLKDLKTPAYGWEDKTEVVNYEELKAEAVKWRKKFTLEYPINIDDWNEFFNLTEEDLK